MTPTQKLIRLRIFVSEFVAYKKDTTPEVLERMKYDEGEFIRRHFFNKSTSFNEYQKEESILKQRLFELRAAAENLRNMAAELDSIINDTENL
jgi:hypothetical protein